MSLDSSFCREEPGERESIRLELVGLAAEIATLSNRIEEELTAADAPRPRSSRLRAGCWRSALFPF